MNKIRSQYGHSSKVIAVLVALPSRASSGKLRNEVNQIGVSTYSPLALITSSIIRYCLTESPNDVVQEDVDAGVVPLLVTLLDNNDVHVIFTTLRTIGNLDTQTMEQQRDKVSGGAPAKRKQRAE
ncbi:hypothetical protein DAPPUDRAFT_320212 [Daphnia pulex]|uniref:Uncharacterized protein n=1 Tax=Daphnia pulex TaxID=6669 RepID=E9GP64_DAPPU|nr:hypothetical protein DAPPUDRAFT_320212 [Daphnia pulex]|eukprot:EFX78584.1 hypothetical protein DAPPUDRAFT_320212 [Daphnia pulex]